MIKNIFLSVLAVTAMVSCNKEPGVGGKAVIRGNVWVERWNFEFTTLQNEYAGADENVYIIYGDNPTYSERVRTGPEGDYEFAYLLPGKYTIYAYSEDSSKAKPTIAILKEVEIADKKQVVTVPTITIFD